MSFVGLGGLGLLALQATSTERADPERFDALRRFGSRNELFAFVSSDSLASVPMPWLYPLDVGRSIMDVAFAGVREVYYAPLLLRLEVSASLSECASRCLMRRSHGCHL